MADMDRAVDVRRSVVQDERLGACPQFADALVQPHLGPARDDGRLRTLEVRLHRKGGAWQIERCFPVRHWANTPCGVKTPIVAPIACRLRRAQPVARGRAAGFEQRHSVPRDGGSFAQTIFERQPAGADGIGEVIGGVVPIQQPDQFAVVGRGHHDAATGYHLVGLLRLLEQFPQHRFRRGDPFGRADAPEQLIEQEELGRWSSQRRTIARTASTSSL